MPWFSLLPMIFLPFAALGADVAQSDREAVQKGSFQACVERTPPEILKHFGPLATMRFCYCYANQIANNVTQQQIDAMIAMPTSAAIPHYTDTMQNARRACKKEYISKWG